MLVSLSASSPIDESTLLRRTAGRLGRIGSWCVDLPASRVMLSEEACAVFDAPPGFAPTLEEILTHCRAEDRDHMSEAFERCVRDGMPWDIELQIVTVTGRRIWVRSIGEAGRDVTGVIRRVDGVIQDIADRKQAVEERRRLSDQLTMTLDSMTDAFFTLDLDWRFTFLNTKAELLLGRGRQELIGREIWTEFPKRAGSASESVYRRAMAEKQTIAYEEFYAPLNTWFSARAYPSEQGLAVSFRDITERKRSETALREINEKFHQLAENITDVFWIRSPDMREVHYVSPAFERIWGRPPEDLYANPQKWLDFTVPEDRERVQAAFATLMADATSIDVEYRILRPDGETRWIRARGFQVRDAAGALIRLTGIVTDITEKRKLESQFLRAQRMEGIGTLAGGIAHDLNNVLAPILMSIDMLGDALTHEDDRMVLATLKESAQRGADLVKQVLSFARGVEGQRITVDPLNVMRELLKVMRDTFPKSIEVDYRPPRDLWTITGDPTQIHQVFLNLCVNARDAMPGGGGLTVALSNVLLDEPSPGTHPDARAGWHVMVTVRDTGIGIPPEVRDRIFEPFFTTKPIGEATGLGLSTTLAIVKSHGGFIDVASEVGAGTTFTVYLPANTTTAAGHAVARLPSPLPSGAGELILVVDDEGGVRKIAKRMLERSGYRVLLAGNGAEAVALYARHQQEIAVVLTDMSMPIMDGPALILALLAINPQVRVIGSSGLAATDGVGEVLNSPVRHFIAKPYTADTLLQTIHQALGKT
jgi:two-component system cell cycle sensor histidine kinase/response regulator CckA